MPIVDNELVAASGDMPFPPVSAGRYLREVIKKNVENFGDSMWMTDVSTSKSMTYSQLLSGMDRVASALLKRGFNTGDTVLFVVSNHVEFPVMFFAVWMLGGINTCLKLNLTPADIRYRIEETAVKFVVVEGGTAPSVLEAVKELDSVEEVFVIGEHPGCTPVEQLMLEDSENDFGKEPINEFDPESMAWLTYSSGTTGISKTIVHPYKNISKLVTFYRNKFCPQRKFLFMNNMYYPSGILMCVVTSVSHTQSYTLSDYSEESFLAAIDKVKPYQISCFPMQLSWICRYPYLDKYDLSSVTVFGMGGSCAFPQHERQIFDKMPNLLILSNIYGMSEVFGISVNVPTEEEMATLNKERAISRHVIGSTGKLLPCNKLKVIDPVSGKKLGPGQVGEICVQTAWMTKGYLNRPDETANAIRDGWFHTGDQGYYDKNEHIFVIGRYKELIKYKGNQVLPSNIEKDLITHPAVEDVAVVGLPHELLRELPLAFIVLKPGKTATAEEIIKFVEDRGIDDENLRGGVRFIDQIPRNDMRKIVRPQLVKLLTS